jgi:hypothetical protein
MAESNGPNENSSRPAWHKLFREQHEAFCAENERLLRSQLEFQDSLARQKERFDQIGDRLNRLIAMVDRDHRDYHERVKRLEEKH